MSNETIWFIVSVAGAIIGLCLTVIGFFLNRLISDGKKTSDDVSKSIRDAFDEIGRNKGRIELIDQQQKNDIKRIEEMTQLEIRTLSKNVSELTTNVNNLVMSLATKNEK